MKRFFFVFLNFIGIFVKNNDNIMDTFGFICTILSFLMMTVFNFICIKRYGLLSCYSAYGEQWANEKKSLNAINIWSLVTIVSALLLVPPILVSSDGHPLQFLCFFTPLYLFLVGITPDYNKVKAHNRLHMTGVILCVISVLFWLFFVVHRLVILFPVYILALVIGMGTRTFDKSWLYYLEMVMYLTAYIALLTV